jgi:hypothetical protein
MRSGRRAHNSLTRSLAIVMIVSLGHAPLPAPDYHNVRHHDGPGEVCSYHDHLLRWHPDAGTSEDVAILHWHWFVPTPGMPASDPARQGPAMHAHLADWLAPTWDGGPQLKPADRPRPLDQPSAGRLLTALPAFDQANAPTGCRASPTPVYAFSATFAPRSPLTSLLMRWLC